MSKIPHRFFLKRKRRCPNSGTICALRYETAARSYAESPETPERAKEEDLYPVFCKELASARAG